MWHVWGTGEERSGFLWGNLRQREHLEDTGIDGRILLKRVLKKWVGDVTALA